MVHKMDMRRQKAEKIAKTEVIKKDGKGWVVPSQSGKGYYNVAQEGTGLTCTCPDFQLRGQPCKHVLSVQIVILRWFDKEGKSAMEVKRVSYPQNWHAYNTSQIN
jgi:predicted nucleic acid-binding Zn finger protein